MIYLFYFLLLFITELGYFKIANYYNISDSPNHRSSHTEVTIRGGGVIFALSVLLWFISAGFQYPLFVSGLLLISAISFIDDLKSISRRVRLTAQLLAMALVYWQLNLLMINWVYIIAITCFFTGVINAYNFMDGINGITGIYSIVNILTLLWLNNCQTYFIDNKLLISILISIGIFVFFNARKKAVCFAGDIGSISMAFIICFLLIKVILQSNNIQYILLLSVYGIDAAFTIILRLFKRQNIFLPHRMHLYQLLVNEAGYKHLTVASLYAVVQLIVNLFIINTPHVYKYHIIVTLLVVITVFYVALRVKVNNHEISKTV